MIKRVKCEIGHFYDGNKYAKCPQCAANWVKKQKEEKKPTKWVDTWSDSMSTFDIVSFGICSGKYPIRHIEFNGNNLVYYNQINGSLDGGRWHPDGFFDKIAIPLSIQENLVIYNTLLDAKLSQWKTDMKIFELSMCPGLCATEEFWCVFKDGRKFRYRAFDSYKAEKMFRKIFSLLYDLCGRPWDIWDEFQNGSVMVKPEKKLYKEICPKCRGLNNPNVNYCGFCGVNLKSLNGMWETSDEEYDLEQTMWMCPSCMAAMPAENLYCDNCGERLPWK